MLTWFWPALRDHTSEDASTLPQAVAAAGAAQGQAHAFARLVTGLAALLRAATPVARARLLALFAGDPTLADALAAHPDDADTAAAETPPPMLASLLDALLRRLHPPQLTDWHPAFDPVVWPLRAHADLAHLATLQDALAHGPLAPDAVQDLHEDGLDRRWLWLRAAGTLALADDQVAPAERALTERLAALSGLPPSESAHVVDLALAEPMTPQDLAARVTDARERDLLVRLMLLMGHADGVAHEAEAPLVEAIARAMGLGGDALDALHVETLTAWAAHSERPESFFAALSYGRVEALVRQNLAAIGTELRETGDLLVLLARSAHTPLTPDEQARMNEQLLDLCRSVPALTIFALPGGAILLPLLARILPFSLTPSAFRTPEPEAPPAPAPVEAKAPADVEP